MNFKDLSTRMKYYEQLETSDTFIPMLPVYIRLDGRSFSNFTNSFNKPYDERMSRIMQEVTKFLVEETNACIGYTQSDEISLVLYSDNIKSDIFFGGKKHKIISVIASLCSVKFVELYKKEFKIDELTKIPVFDCRAYQVPNCEEAVNAVYCRNQDAIRNSIQMAAHAVFSHKELQNKSTTVIKDELLTKKGINWNHYPKFFKEGTFFKRTLVEYENSYGKFQRHEIQEVLSKTPFKNLNMKEKLYLFFGKE